MKAKERLRKFWKDWAKPILIVGLVVGSARSVIADWYVVPTGSMKPTILEGDRIFVNKLAYDLKVPFTKWRIVEWGGPEPGDIVIFPNPMDGTRYVKRVVGVPGDTVEVRDNLIWINGAPANYRPIDPAVAQQLTRDDQARSQFATETLGEHAHAIMRTPREPSMRSSFGPVVVPEGQYFVMGDNRDNSLDSRWFGLVDRSRILGRAICVIVSSGDEDSLLRWQRMLAPLP